MSDKMKGAMSAVLEDMGRAAREGRARRFTKKRMAKADVPVDPVKSSTVSPEEDTELMNALTVER